MNSSRRWDRLICDFSVWYLVYFSWQSTKGQKNKAEIRLLTTLRLFCDNWGVWQQATLPFFLHMHKGYSPIPLIVSEFQSIASFSCILFPLMKTQGRKKMNRLFVWSFIWSDVRFLLFFLHFCLVTGTQLVFPSLWFQSTMAAFVRLEFAQIMLQCTDTTISTAATAHDIWMCYLHCIYIVFISVRLHC